MSVTKKTMRVLSALLLFAAFSMSGCSTNSPTEPAQNPRPPGVPPSGATWAITVTATPNQVAAGTTDGLAIRITVRRADNGQAPPDGTTMGVSATGGSFIVAGGAQSVVASLLGGFAEFLYFPPGTEGSVTISAQLESSVGRTQITVSGVATFFLQGVSPNTGSPEGGQSMRITGGGFKSPVRVTMAGVTASVQSVAADLIRVLTPAINLGAGQNVTVDVTVENAFGTEEAGTDTLSGVFTYTRSTGPPTALQVFSISPASGPNEGGTRVVILGEGFELPVQVLFGSGNTTSFNGVEASVESVTPTQIVATTPAATGFGQTNRDTTVDVLVRNRNTGAATIRTGAFQFGTAVRITSIAPSEGPAAGLQRVTVFGQGFDEPVAVSFAGVGADIISVTGTEIIARTRGVEIDDCSDVNGPTAVTNIETGATDNSGPLYLYRVADGPEIIAVSPASVPQAGGVLMTVDGRNFVQPLRVLLDGGVVAATVISSTRLQFTLPGIPNADLDTETCNDNGDTQEGERFIDTAVDLEVQVDHLNTGCTDTQSVKLTFRPTDRSCRDDVAPPEEVQPPTADFTFTIVGLVVAFDEAATGAVSYSWNFGEPAFPNNTSNQANPSHTYQAPGPYLVRLTVTNSAGSDTASKQVVIPP